MLGSLCVFVYVFIQVFVFCVSVFVFVCVFRLYVYSRSSFVCICVVCGFLCFSVLACLFLSFVCVNSCAVCCLFICQVCGRCIFVFFVQLYLCVYFMCMRACVCMRQFVGGRRFGVEGFVQILWFLVLFRCEVFIFWVGSLCSCYQIWERVCGGVFVFRLVWVLS